ncbi:Cytochrome d ubiquinol oxidase subunit 2 [Vibrio nigripulchritudo SFn27]|uniref:Cytochrome d ubiquinol oxidase subunit 2 n=1 Tax=Vibrio nigripulchritudo TaxID=28173 RepID=U4KIH8_9VIBR|nr:cytochrome d ubiquinol oxidase subunit II [Vibrio nigripulchritudo]CCN80452.1 Cytochrome d ubiquinol oxidase subunit 2 [Vibrio nigripulchritudo BLFn1]CCN86925.1 Cytochrome d ubiquinol oxidase subunit 2 [Vibrio nigripulchritudo SFn27]CCN92400.1 Cytochrome d ubiquinol oxidase subunit 2 [Vibrio nigripulchritudo ENn2]CCO39740.1 Cytochrome d ubiquinol oxidase subunit 2 [Vibrio nigripulchritudo SFn135]CCO53331.1 Cytochrome d ubiquinol oxidase subunit 2 [Vibrio nigripulchritudo Wn13]
MFEYETLRLIWWVLIGVLLIGFMVTDGFDMGVGALVPFVGKDEYERRLMINSIAPHWDGNQVWLITAGGALFAAWPLVYATSFSSFYLAMYLTLAALWFRPLALEYRAKIESAKWKQYCDIAISFSGGIPPIMFGVAFGNLIQGIPFELNSLLMPSYHGSFIDLLNPFALLCGVVGLCMALLQGSTWLLMKSSEDVYLRARKIAQVIALVLVALFMLGGWMLFDVNGYQITSPMDLNADSNPVVKEVLLQKGLWFENYRQCPLMAMAPVVGFIALFSASLAARLSKNGLAFVSSSLANASIVATAGLTMFPFIIPSSHSPDHSLTLWDATSSELTLNAMTLVAFVMVPVILGYTSWTYYKMFGRLDTKFVKENSNSLY